MCVDSTVMSSWRLRHQNQLQLCQPVSTPKVRKLDVFSCEKRTRVSESLSAGQQQVLKCYMLWITSSSCPLSAVIYHWTLVGTTTGEGSSILFYQKKVPIGHGTVFWSEEPGLLWNSLSLAGLVLQTSMRSAPLQSWMHNSGSCTVLGSCLYKECPAAGKTHRPGFSWRASVLVGQLSRVNKSQDLLFRWPRSPQVDQEMLGTPGDGAFPVALSKVLSKPRPLRLNRKDFTSLVGLDQTKVTST